MRNLPYSIRDRVARGIALLDAKCPNWRESIDVDTLNVGSDGQCVLGQLTGTYQYGVALLFGRGADPRGDEVATHGFNIRPRELLFTWDEDASRQKYAPLTRAWKAALTA